MTRLWACSGLWNEYMRPDLNVRCKFQCTEEEEGEMRVGMWKNAATFGVRRDDGRWSSGCLK